MAKRPKSNLDTIAEATVSAQAVSLACTLVMTQLLTHWALKQKNPSKSLRNMYDAIVRKLDVGIDLQAGFEPDSVANARILIDDLLFSLGSALDRRR